MCIFNCTRSANPNHNRGAPWSEVFRPTFWLKGINLVITVSYVVMSKKEKEKCLDFRIFQINCRWVVKSEIRILASCLSILRSKTNYYFSERNESN